MAILHPHKSPLTSAVLAWPVPGISHVPAATPLTRLNYFDGRFLRAEDLELEQRYVRELVALANQGGGAGVVHGLTVERAAGDRLAIDAGLAISATGRMLFLPEPTSIGVSELIERSGAPGAVGPGSKPGAGGVAGSAAFDECTVDTGAPPDQVGATTTHWVLVVGPADVLCGEDVVYGRLCEDACATATEHSHRVDALVFRAVPVDLTLPTSTYLSPVHLRSQVASAYFDREREHHPILISAAGLRSPGWCDGAAALSGAEVPLAIIARSGSITRFVDMWTARRERLEPPGLVHWQWRMRMRPLDVFLAHVLQFQCQLPDALEGPDPIPPDVVDSLRDCLDEHAKAAPSINVDEMLLMLGNLVGSSGAFGKSLGMYRPAAYGPLGDATVAASAGTGPGALMRGGLVELPPVGWLPVTTGAPVEPQVAALMGAGVDLRFCAVRHDFPPEAFWEAQHLERISLWQGLEDPQRRPEVDVLVPDPTIRVTEVARQATAFATHARISPEGDESVSVLSGVTRIRATDGRIRVAGALVGPLAERQSASGTVTHVRSLFLGEAAEVRRRLSTEHLTVLAEGPELRSVRNAARHFIDHVEAARPEFAVAEGDSRLLVTVYDLTVGGTPLTADVGDQIPLTLSLVAAFPSAQSRSRTLEVDAQLKVTGVLPHGDVRTIVGRLRATARVGAGSPQAFTAETTISVAQRDGRTTLTIKGIPRSTSAEGRAEELPPVDLVAEWGGSPVRVRATLTVKGDNGSAPVLQAELVESATVLLGGDALHERAETAIEAVAAILEDRERATELARFILDQGEAPSRTQTLVPTRDWVMFHRRRPIECDVQPPPEQPAPPPPAPTLDRVDILALRPKSAEQAERLLAALHDGTLTLDSALRIIGADFLPGSPVMVTADATVAQAVASLLGADRKLVGTGYVAPGSAHRAGRVTEFADALGVGAGSVTVIDAAPADRGYSAADEVFVVITTRALTEQPITATHVVYDAVGVDVERLLALVGTGIEAGIPLEDLLKRAGVGDMGTVTFSGTTLISHTLPADRSSTFAEAYITVSNDPADLADETATPRAKAIAEVILRPLGLVRALESRSAMQAPAWIVTRRNGDNVIRTFDTIRLFDTIHR